MKKIKRTAKLFQALGVLSLLLLASVAIYAQEAQPMSTPPPPAEPRSVQVPKPVEKTLANGLRVVSVERSNTPLISAQLIIKNGAEVDPAEQPGLANITANLLTKGTEKRSAPEIADAIEALGGDLDAGARWDASRASINVMSSKISPAMEILADVIRRPTFKEDEIDRLKQQTLDDLTVELGQPGSIARYVASRIVFGDSAYGHPLSGTLQSIPSISRDDIVKMHAQYYRPDNAILIIGGDISAKDAFALAERYFGDWKKPTTPLPVVKKATVSTAKPQIVVIDKPDAGQAAVLVARLGIERRDPDYFRGVVANSVLSGYSGRLNQEIRIKRGLSYGAASSLDTRRDVGPFVASAQTKNESGAQVAELLLGEVERLASAPPAQAELVPRKSVVIGNFSRNLETVNGLVAQIGSLALYGISFDEINRFISNVQGITTEDVQKFASTRLPATGTNVIIVGNAKEFLPALQKLYPNVRVIPMSELDLNSSLLRKKQVTQQ